MDFIQMEVSFVYAPIREFEGAMSLLLPVLVVSSVLCSIWPHLRAIATLLVVDPLPVIDCSIGVDVLTSTICFVV